MMMADLLLVKFEVRELKTNFCKIFGGKVGRGLEEGRNKMRKSQPH